MQNFIMIPQCGNFMIFLSLRFYVKSILEDLEVLKLPFLPFLKAKIHQTKSKNIRAPKIAINGRSSKIDFT